jgi:hypothetical protein
MELKHPINEGFLFFDVQCMVRRLERFMNMIGFRPMLGDSNALEAAFRDR